MSFWQQTKLQNAAGIVVNPATSEKQDSGNTSISNVDANIGAKADTSATTDSGTFSLIALVKRLLGHLTNIYTRQADGNATTKLSAGTNIVGKVGIDQTTPGTTNAVAAKFIDESGVSYGIKQIDNKPRFSSMPYTYDISQGNVSGKSCWTKIGFTGTMNTTESDIWSATGVYAFSTSEAKWEVVSSDNTQDIGTVIKGDPTGNTVQSDAGGSATTLVDADVDFTAATAVAVGDCVILDPHGTTPEWGYVTGVDTHTLTIAGGFSSGGTGASRYYAVIDYSAHTNAHAVKIEYLDDAFAEKSEIVVLNGTTVVDTINTDFYRVNSFRVIAAGSNAKALGNLTVRIDGGGATKSYILAGFTRARNSAYTVPAGKVLYVTHISMSYATTGNANKEYARLYTRVNMEPSTRFKTGSIFYPYSEVVAQNLTVSFALECPTKIPAGMDLKVSGVASATGIAQSTLRGWIESA